MTTTINNEHKKLNVPNLRFPEFQGEWEKFKLSDLCTFFSGGTPSSSNKDFYGGDIAFIRSGELHADSTELFISQDGYDNSSAKMVEIGDLLLAMYGATSGDIAISKIKGAINQAILCIRTNQNKKFIESVWNKHVSKILRKYLQGGQGNLSADIVKGISFSFPTLEEQERIANLISLLDERIATQNKVIEDLKKLKSAIIEKHYSQVKKQTTCIADLGEPFSVGSLAKDDLAEIGSPCVIYGELFTTYGEIIFHIESYTNKTDGMILSKKGDLLFPSSTTVDAMSLIAPSVINVDGVILGGDMFGIHISHNYNAQYLSYYFNHIAKKQLAKFAKGSTIIHLHYTDIEKAKLLLPSLEEQNRMAKCLVALDKKVSVEQNLLSSLTCQKSFLLQQMFI
jgi:type I restriction enzyme S subunit